MNPETQLQECLETSQLEDKIDILFREVELAARWERPSILFAIYRSESVRDQAMGELDDRLNSIGQKTLLLAPGDKGLYDYLEELSKDLDLSHNLLFIDSRKFQDDQPGKGIFEEINKYREYFIDNSLRAVFWLCDQDVQKFATRATECWYLRHRVIDFTDEINPDQLFLNTLESYIQTQQVDLSPGQVTARLQQDVDNLSEDLTLQPSHASTLYILGLLCSRKHDHPNALNLLHAALDISKTAKDPELQTRCLKAIAMIQARSGNIPEAVSLYKQALPLASKPGLIWKNIGLLLSTTQERQQAVDAFHQAVKNSPQDHLAWLHLGISYLDQGSFEKAVSAFETSLELHPSSDQAWAGLGKAYNRLGEIEQAVAALQKAIQFNAQNAQAWTELGFGFLQQKKTAEALMAYKNATEADPGNFEAWNDLVRLYMTHKEYENAITAAHNAIRLRPDSGSAYLNMGLAKYQLGDYSQAAFLFEQAIPLFDDRKTRSELWKYLAETQLKLNNHEMARSAFNQADRLAEPLGLSNQKSDQQASPETNPLPPTIGGTPMMESTRTFETRTAKEWNDLGNTFLKSGAYKKAVFAYTKAIETATDNNWPYIKNLAIANYQMGKKSGKRIPDQQDNSELWELEEEEDEEIVSFSAVDDMPMPERGDFPPSSDQEMPSLATETAPVSEDPVPAAPVEASAPAEEAPTKEDDWNELGNYYAASGDFEKAIEAYKKSIQMNPKYGQPYSNLGLAYFKKGDYRSAILLYQTSIELLNTAEDKAATLNKLGDAYRQAHKYENALSAYKKAEELAPSTSPILNRARYSLLQNTVG